MSFVNNNVEFTCYNVGKLFIMCENLLTFFFLYLLFFWCEMNNEWQIFSLCQRFSEFLSICKIFFQMMGKSSRRWKYLYRSFLITDLNKSSSFYLYTVFPTDCLRSSLVFWLDYCINSSENMLFSKQPSAMC